MSGNPMARKSVQEHYVRVREVADQMLCVADESALTKRKYVAILRIDGVNYALKSKPEQMRVVAQFRTLLQTLKYPIQILIRILPLGLEEYTRQFEELASDTPIRRELKRAHIEHIQHLESDQGGLLERITYVVIPFTEALDPLNSLRFLRKRKRQHAGTLQQAQQQLTLRCQEVTRALTRMKLQVRRLSTAELVQTYYSCVMEQRDPLPQPILSVLDQPVRTRDLLPDLEPENEAQRREAEAPLPELDLTSLRRTDVSRSGKKKRTQSSPAHLPVYTQLADVAAPAGAKLHMNELLLIDKQKEHTRTLVVGALAREMVPGWIMPLVEIDEPFVTISLHIAPETVGQALGKLKDAQNTYLAKKIYANKKGTILDVDSVVEGEDTQRLITKVASGEETMLDVSMYVLVRAHTAQELDERCQRVNSVLDSIQVKAHPAVFLQDQGFRSCLPEANNELAFWGALFLDSTSLASFFPFTSHSFYMPTGAFIGTTTTTKSDPIILDRWNEQLPNANCLYIGPPGSGKSYAKKGEEERLWLQNRDRQFLVLDPEREWMEICEQLGGQWIRLAPGSGHRINLFDLYALDMQSAEAEAWAIEEQSPELARGDRLAEKVQSLREIFQIMLAQHGAEGIVPLQPEVVGYLERCIYEAYRRVGITSKDNTRGQQPPLLRDVYEIIEKQVFGPDPFALLSRLYPFVYGSHKAFFDGPTNVRLSDRLVVIDTKELDTELLPVALALISDYVWTQGFTSHKLIPREFVIDEAGILADYEAWACFMSNIVARARKRYLAVSLMLQNLESFNSRWAKTIASNCATTVIFGHPQTRMLREQFDLSDNEETFISTCSTGEALILTPSKHIMARFAANPREHRMNSTNPVERAEWREEERQKREKAQI